MINDHEKARVRTLLVTAIAPLVFEEDDTLVKVVEGVIELAAEEGASVEEVSYWVAKLVRLEARGHDGMQ